MSVFWRKKDIVLIDLVRMNPILYDPNHKHFRNYFMRQKIWESISNTLRIPILSVKKRWRHLRDQYHKKVKKHKKGTMLEKDWKYMRRLEFLPTTTTTPARDSSDQEAAAGDPRPEEGSESDQLGTDPAGAHSEGGRLPGDPSERSPVHKFFEAMAAVVAQFPPRLAAEARLHVCQLVTDMELQMHAEQDVCHTSDVILVKREN